MLVRGGLPFFCVVGLAILSAIACSDRHLPDELTASVRGAVIQNAGSVVPCAALANAVTATTGNVYSNSASLVDSFDSTQGVYGGSTVGNNGRVQAALAILNFGGVVNGPEVVNSPANVAVIPVPAGAIKLPLGSAAPGNVNINIASDSITLAPGNYVAASLNVNFNGAITISPPGPVSIWVTGSLNLGGKENDRGSPANLTFLVTSAGTSNVNANGRMYGNIYAPTSTVIVNSAVFGSVVGSTVKLNSGAAVHFDQGGACSAPVPIKGTPPQKLPPPPNAQGCYVGTWNGWLSVPCTPFDQLPTGLQRRPYIGGGQGVIAGYLNGGVDEYGTMPGIHTADANGLKFGQVDTTVVNIAPSTPSQPAEDDLCFNLQPGFCSAVSSTPNTFSVQLNTNPFLASTGPANFPNGMATHPGWVAGDQGWVQFTLQSNGSNKAFSVCVWQVDFTQGKLFTLAANNAYIPKCVQTSGTQQFATQGRDLKPLDNASVAGSAFLDANGTDHDLGIVAQLSWWDPAQAPNNFRGLYATVAKDLYGLWQSGKWTTASGTLIGEGSGSTARFKNASVLTKLVAGNCAQTTQVPGQGQTGVSCASTLPTAGAAASTLQFTDESNDLNIVPSTQTSVALTTDGNSNLAMQYLAASGSPAQCDATPHAFVKDYSQDNGSTPSNLNGQAFWESPDLILVPAGGAATDPPITQIVANKPYSIWVAVHNDYGCADVSGLTARVRFGDASLASPTWTDVIPTSDNYFGPLVTVPRFGSGFIGPIPWVAPQTADPHQCLLAIVKGAQEPPPANLTDTPGSNQVAQRNIEVGNDCAWTLANGTGANGLGAITIKTVTGTVDGQPYTPVPGDIVRVQFSDPGGQTFFTHWPTPPGANPPYTVTNSNGVTTVQLLSTGFVSMPSVALASNQMTNVTSQVIPALFSGATIDLQISAVLSNGGAFPVVSNGASCQATATQGPPK